MPTSPHSQAEKNRILQLENREGMEQNPLTRKSLQQLLRTDEIALYYGFTPIETPATGKLDPLANKFLKELHATMKEKDQAEKSTAFNHCLEEECALLYTYENSNLIKLPQPVMLSYESAPHGKRKPHERNFNVHVVGASKSIAEATIIKTALVILAEEGYTDLSVEINSLGDKDSAAKFMRELTTYYRKHLSSLPAECKQTLKRDPLELLLCKHEKCMELAAEAPKSISFLTEKGRTHFKEVLEYLETLEIPYSINNSLVGKRAAVETVFEIHDGTGKTLGTGMRYDALSKRIGLKKEVPAVGMQLVFQAKEQAKIKKTAHFVRKPKFYFIQLGFDAKLKSLKVIEMLRQAKVPLFQSLSKDKLIGQMTVAENLKIPYTIIMGQKEAMENTVIVRNMISRSQETIRIDELPAYLENTK